MKPTWIFALIVISACDADHRQAPPVDGSADTQPVLPPACPDVIACPGCAVLAVWPR